MKELGGCADEKLGVRVGCVILRFLDFVPDVGCALEELLASGWSCSCDADILMRCLVMC